MATINESVTSILEALSPKKGARNTEAVLFEICKWQEAKSIADRNLKTAWAKAQEEDGLIPDDEKLRKKKLGTHIVTEGGKFSVTAKLSAGDNRLDPEKLAAKMARKFKVPLADCVKLIEASRTQGNPKLEKRVLEA